MVAEEDEKPGFSGSLKCPASVPEGCEGFDYQYLESLAQNGKDQRYPPQTYTLPSAQSA